MKTIFEGYYAGWDREYDNGIEITKYDSLSEQNEINGEDLSDFFENSEELWEREQNGDPIPVFVVTIEPSDDGMYTENIFLTLEEALKCVSKYNPIKK